MGIYTNKQRQKKILTELYHWLADGKYLDKDFQCAMNLTSRESGWLWSYLGELLKEEIGLNEYTLRPEV